MPNYSKSKFEINGTLYTVNENIVTHNGSSVSIFETAVKYLNSPYLWGGRTPVGIDCSGFVQVVYSMFGVQLPRDSSEQAEFGSTIDFIEEAQEGDLAFFDNEEQKIIHVGILLDNKKIIHASGKVRIDEIDHNGIYIADEKKYSHKLRIIKRIVG